MKQKQRRNTLLSTHLQQILNSRVKQEFLIEDSRGVRSPHISEADADIQNDLAW